jgi:cysteinyl-tRNA synthetase
VRYWLHTGPLNVGAHKMSKSLGNFIRVRDALSRYPADLLRIFVAGHQYRAPVVVDEERFRLARRHLAVFREALKALRDNQANRSLSPRIELRPRRRITESETAFRQAMNDDFDTPRALAIGLDLARLIVQKRRTGDNLHQLAGHGLTAMLDVFGVLQERRLAQSPITGGA